MSNERATKKQQELLQFVDGFIREHGYGPSYREIMAGLGYKSVSTVAIHIDGLIAKGYLNRRDNSARSLEVTTMGADDTTSTKKPSSTVIHEVKMLLEKDIKQADRAILVRALELLGYDEASMELKEKYGFESTETG